MGMCTSRNKRGGYECECEKDALMFIHKMRLLQQEINAILKQREEETEAYEREMMVFAFKEVEWRREKKKLKDEVKRLQRCLEERERRISQMEGVVGKEEKLLEGESVESRTAASLLLMEQMREERARRDEAVEKWKMLYLDIKNELDDLIQRTHQGTLHWRQDDEDIMEDLQQALRAKDETIEALKAQIASMENEEYKRKREVDILRQSLRIMSNKKAATSPAPVVKKSVSKSSTRLPKSLSKLAFVN